MASAQTIAEMKVVYTADGVQLQETTREVGKELTDTEKAMAAHEKMVMRLAGAIDPLVNQYGRLAKQFNALNATEAKGGVTDQTSALRATLDAKNEKLSQQKTLQQQVADEAQRMAESETAATKRFLESVDPTLRAFNALDKNVAELHQRFESGLIPEAQFEKLKAQFDEEREALYALSEAGEVAGHRLASGFSAHELAAKKAGISVGQYTMALRTLPMQMTDIVTQLAGGQNPLLILIQQGGQVRDSFGGIRPALGAVAGILSPVTLGVGALAATVGTLGMAWSQGHKEGDEFNRQLLLTGGYAGKTTEQLSVMAKSLSGDLVTQHKAAEILAQVVGSGAFDADRLETVTRAALAMEKATGQAVDKTVEQFKKLYSDPVKSSEQLNEQLHYLTSSQYDYIATLDRRGEKEAAGEAAARAYSDAEQQRSQLILNNMGLIERAADNVRGALKSMWDELLDIGRPQAPDDMLKRMQDELALREKALLPERPRTGYGYSVDTSSDNQDYDNRRKAQIAAILALRAQIAPLRQRISLQNDAASAAQKAKKADDDMTESLEYQNRILSKNLSWQQHRSAALSELWKEIAKAPGKWSEEQRQTAVAQINKDNAPPKTPHTKAYHDDEGTKRLATLKEQAEVLREQSETLKGTLNLDDRLTESDKKLAAFHAEIAGLAGKKLTAEQQSLILHQGEIDTQLRLNAAQEKENLIIQAANKLMAEQRGIRLSTDRLKTQTEADVAGVTLSQKEREHQEKIQSIRDNFAAKQMQLEDDKAQYTKEQLLQQTEFLRQQMQVQIDTVSKGEQAKAAEQQNFLGGAMAGMQDWANNQMDLADRVRQATTGLFDSMSQSVINFALTGKMNFRNFTAEILKDIARIAMQVAISKAVAAILESFGGGGGGNTPSGAYDAAAANVSFNALGGVYQSSSLSAFSGQVVARPTLFAFAHGAGLMGEAGPEGIFPLRRGADGKLGVVAQMAGGGSPVFAPQYNISIQNDGQNGQIGPQALQTVYDVSKKAAADFAREQQRDGGSMRRF